MNEYTNGATPAQTVGHRIIIPRRYARGLGAGGVVPTPLPMDLALRTRILRQVPAAE